MLRVDKSMPCVCALGVFRYLKPLAPDDADGLRMSPPWFPA